MLGSGLGLGLRRALTAPSREADGRSDECGDSRKRGSHGGRGAHLPASPEVSASPGLGAVIFDLDGVLVDSEIWWDEARASFAAAHGRPWSVADRLAVMGANSPTWSRIMRERLGLDLAAAEIERAIVDAMAERYRHEGPPLIDGAVQAVRRIAGQLRVAVGSSAHPRVIEAALDATGLADAFGAVVSADEVAHGKPAPDVYLEAARRLGIAPERCLVVEDSLNGVRSGRAAGMVVVLVPNVSIPPAEGARELAHVTLERLADLDPNRVALAYFARPQP
jgi:HAD superfamily hydrolase (TIGR01509 family)